MCVCHRYAKLREEQDAHVADLSRSMSRSVTSADGGTAAPGADATAQQELEHARATSRRLVDQLSQQRRSLHSMREAKDKVIAALRTARLKDQAVIAKQRVALQRTREAWPENAGV